MLSSQAQKDMCATRRQHAYNLTTARYPVHCHSHNVHQDWCA